MESTAATRAKLRKRLSKARVRKAADLPNKVAEEHMAEVFRRLQEMGVLSGRTKKVSVRIDRGLLAAAARKLGSANTTAIVQTALAAFVALDPFVEWFLSDRDRLPADFELAI